MDKTLLVLIVGSSLFASSLTHQRNRQSRRDPPCYPIASEMDVCDTNKVCAWNKRTCPTDVTCRLVCTDDPYKLCYGRSMGQTCRDTSGGYDCIPDSRSGELVCAQDICVHTY